MLKFAVSFALLLSVLGFVHAGFHPIVTPDILDRVSHVLSHGYGGPIHLSYPEKAHLVDFYHTIQPSYGYGGHHSFGGGHNSFGGGHHSFGGGHAGGGLFGGQGYGSHGYGGYGGGHGRYIRGHY